MEADFDLGNCCVCGQAEGTRNVMMLDLRAPVPRTGWGCLICDLPNDGAVAVLCDPCLEAVQQGEQVIRQVCVGYAKENQRIPLETLTEAFPHDDEKHRERLSVHD